MSITGTYVFDKKLGKIVKVSDDIPKVAARHAKGGFEMPATPCGRPQCSGGSCAMQE